MKIVSGSTYYLPEKGYYNCYYPNKKSGKTIDGDEEIILYSRYNVKGILPDYSVFYFKLDEDKIIYFTETKNRNKKA